MAAVSLTCFMMTYYIITEVRNTTLDSLCELASQSLSFALLSQDSITDMFNDEIESVRLNAINSLKKLSQYLEIREDQLEIMLGVLQVYLLNSTFIAIYVCFFYGIIIFFLQLSNFFYFQNLPPLLRDLS